MVNFGDIKSNDPMQLKQTIIFLRAELNKYKTAEPAPRQIHEIQEENRQIKEDYQQLLYANQKLEKRLRIYQKRIQTLENNRKTHAFLSAPSEDHIQHAVDRLEAMTQNLGKELSLLQTDQTERKRLVELLDEQKGKLELLQNKLQEEQKLSQLQHELIALLETYTERLTTKTEPDQPDYILQQIISLTELYKKKSSESEQ